METILSSLRSLSSRLLKEVELLDIYRHEKLGLDRKNVTLRFSYRDDQKTLSQEAVDKEHARLLALGQQKLSSSLV
jgi:phenylalanyl-tRNA synthetase beta chain